jgi:endonuclease/exonuclease/phosphatase (EEP) superfamily protein YafD
MSRHRGRRTELAAFLTLVGITVLVLLAGVALAWLLLAVFADPARAATGAGSGQVPGVSTEVARVQYPTVRVATYNTFRHRSASSVHRDIARVTRWTDVLALQETARPAWVTLRPGWSHFRPGGAAYPRPIMWRSARFRLLSSGTSMAQRRPFYRRNTWVVLRDKRTGQRLTVFNYHGVPHVERRGHPRFPRARNYAESMRRMHTSLGNLPGPLAVTGDWNVDRQADRRVRWYGFPSRMASRTNLTADASARGTLHVRTVDYLFHRRHRGLARTGVHVGQRGGSDHRPVTVTYNVHAD